MLCRRQALPNAVTCRIVRPNGLIKQSPAFSRRQRALVVTQAAERAPAAAAANLLDQGYKYADVRTPQEFAAGHPKGSVNLPFMLPTPEGMKPNAEFLQAWKKTFPDTSAPIVVGCKSGNRSARACALLTEEGYSNLVDNATGYDGWVADGLPLE